MSDQAFPLIGMMMGGLALAVLAFALLSDWLVQRFRRRRRCPRCWYDMRATQALRCSECGHEAKRERKLFKARRRWRLVWLALLMFAGSYALGATPGVKERGWVAAVPTTALIAALPWLEVPLSDSTIQRGRGTNSGRQALLADLYKRWADDQLPDWQEQVLLEHSVATTTWNGIWGDTTADAPAWIGRQVLYSYEVEETLRFYVPLLERYKSDLVRTRDVWVEGVPLRIHIRLSWYYATVGAHGELEVTPDFEDARTASRSYINIPHKATFAWHDPARNIGTPPSGVNEVSLNLRWRMRDRADEMWQSSITKPVQLVPHVHEILQPYEGSYITDQLKRFVQVGSVTDRSPAHVHLRFTDAPYGVPDDVAIGFTAQVLEGESVVLEGGMWFDNIEAIARGIPLSLDGDVAHLMRSNTDDPRWRLVIRGDPIVALRDFDATRYWSGEFEMPLKDALRR